jgi:hypothetical protein
LGSTPNRICRYERSAAQSLFRSGWDPRDASKTTVLTLWSHTRATGAEHFAARRLGPRGVGLVGRRREMQGQWAEAGNPAPWTQVSLFFLFIYLFIYFYFKFKSNSSLNSKLLLLDAQIKRQHECKTMYIYIYVYLYLFYFSSFIHDEIENSLHLMNF